ncbi:hypothetical protein LF1_50370 [Rubripirellula obstinata]|uniref:Uncharacterized protein n=1 Tax=Rubripirellula obstinata TaxID=406547 RepID=A0A5B1CQ07_9BACT|nr:hypothetical protein LF1_50370 [Rubripirellula obstinata]
MPTRLNSLETRRGVRLNPGGKIGSESRQDFRFGELPKLLASFATPLIVPTARSRVGIAQRVVPERAGRCLG